MSCLSERQAATVGQIGLRAADVFIRRLLFCCVGGQEANRTVVWTQRAQCVPGGCVRVQAWQR
eukprot:5552650-Lingulodinium_polyedra.AAC.1